LVPIAKFWKILIMAMDWKSLDFNTKLEIIHLYKGENLSKKQN
jgi:hypothetical protein